MMLWSWLVAVSDVSVLASITAPSTATIWMPSLWSSFCCRSWMKLPVIVTSPAPATWMPSAPAATSSLLSMRMPSTHRLGVGRSLADVDVPGRTELVGHVLAGDPAVFDGDVARAADDVDAGVVRRVDGDVGEEDGAAAAGDRHCVGRRVLVPGDRQATDGHVVGAVEDQPGDDHRVPRRRRRS